VRRYFAEFLGTFVLVFGGVGSAVLAGSHIGFVGVGFAFGLSLLAMVYTIGPISGCHINPAVTVGVLLAKRIGSRDAVMYMVAQIFGAIAASALILFIASGVAGGYDFAANGLGANGLHNIGLLSGVGYRTFLLETIACAATAGFFSFKNPDSD
jgi:aquaporin Z